MWLLKNGINYMSDKNSSNAMWGGRFASGPDAIMESINASISTKTEPIL